MFAPCRELRGILLLLSTCYTHHHSPMPVTRHRHEKLSEVTYSEVFSSDKTIWRQKFSETTYSEENFPRQLLQQPSVAGYRAMLANRDRCS